MHSLEMLSKPILDSWLSNSRIMLISEINNLLGSFCLCVFDFKIREPTYCLQNVYSKYPWKQNSQCFIDFLFQY